MVAVGLQTVFGIGEETTYGTAVVPSRFLPITEESLELSKEEIEDNSIYPGGYEAKRSETYETGDRNPEGSFSLQVTTKSMGLLFKHILGPTLTPTVTQQAATTAYLHTYLPGLSGGKALTVQKQLRDNAGAVVAAFDYPGTKITKASFSVESNGFLILEVDVNSRDEVVQASPATASYVTSRPFHFAQGELRIAGTAVSDVVKEASIEIERPLDVERFGLGNNGLKSEPAENDSLTVGGSLTSEFNNLTSYYNRFNANTPLELVLEFVGANIASTYDERLTITLADIRMTGETPKVGGKELVELSVPFVARHNGTDPTIELQYMTTDVAV